MAITVCGSGAMVTLVLEGLLVPGGDGGTRDNAAKEVRTGCGAGECGCIGMIPCAR